MLYCAGWEAVSMGRVGGLCGWAVWAGRLHALWVGCAGGRCGRCGRGACKPLPSSEIARSSAEARWLTSDCSDVSMLALVGA